MRPVPTWWPTRPKPGNLGDILTPVILGRLDIPVEWYPFEEAELIATGSILGKARAGISVFGSGAMTKAAAPHPEAQLWAVRGPRSLEIARMAGADVSETALGDPALLLPFVHAPYIERCHPLGLVPHYVDREEAVSLTLPPGTRFINVLRADPLEVVDEIQSCEAVVSSSLHGLIVAQTYGIPYAWMRLSDKLNGDDTKFYDFAEAVGVELKPHTTVACAMDNLVCGDFNALPLLMAFERMRKWFRD